MGTSNRVKTTRLTQHGEVGESVLSADATSRATTQRQDPVEGWRCMHAVRRWTAGNVKHSQKVSAAVMNHKSGKMPAGGVGATSHVARVGVRFLAIGDQFISRFIPALLRLPFVTCRTSIWQTVAFHFSPQSRTGGRLRIFPPALG